MNRKQVFLLFAGASMFVILTSWLLVAPRLLAVGRAQPLAQAEADTQICPLSDKQQDDAIKKFAAMMPTFTHPRCINCHGALNPFAANTNHVGGRIGTKFKEEIRHDDILDRDIKIVVMDVGDADEPGAALFGKCQDCHSAFPKWRLPPPHFWFVGKDSVQLCKQIKREFGTELQQFIDHLDHDVRDPFIQEAFRGTRGLDENGRAIYLNETGKEFKPEPLPPISHQAFVGQGRAWVLAMGPDAAEKYKGGITCGCEPHQYLLKIVIDQAIHYVATDIQGDFTGHNEVKIPIKFNDDGSFSDETETDFTYVGSMNGGGVDCNGSIQSKGETWRLSGKLDGDSMDATLTETYPNPVLSGVCSSSGGSQAVTMPQPAGERRSNFSGFFVVGEPVTIIDESTPDGASLKVQVTVVEEKK